MQELHVLVDFDNLHKTVAATFPISRRRNDMDRDTLGWSLERLSAILDTDTIAHAQWHDAQIISCRLYGGWYENGRATDQAEIISRQLQNQPKRLKRKKIRFELAERLLDAPSTLLPDSVQRRERFPSIKLALPAIACGAPTTCAMSHVQMAVENQRCTQSGCSVKFSDIISAREQKGVDVHMALDLISLGRDGEHTTIITDDFDLIPPALLFGSQSPDKLLWVSLKNTVSIETFLRRSNIRFTSL